MPEQLPLWEQEFAMATATSVFMCPRCGSMDIRLVQARYIKGLTFAWCRECQYMDQCEEGEHG